MLKRNPAQRCQFLRRCSIPSPLQDTLRLIRRVLFCNVKVCAGHDSTPSPSSAQPLLVSPWPRSLARPQAAPANRTRRHRESCTSRNVPVSPSRLCSHASLRSRTKSSHPRVDSPSAPPCPPNILHESTPPPDSAAPSRHFPSRHESLPAKRIPPLPGVPIRESSRSPKC